jgi:predicted nucleotide-binding protein
VGMSLKASTDPHPLNSRSRSVQGAYDGRVAHSSTQLGTVKPRVFIGSSTEGLDIAKHLQVALEMTDLCVATVWNQNVFEPSNYAMESLATQAEDSDFAVLVATADDTVSSRGGSRSTARDNVIFELGLFIGVLGRARTYIVTKEGEALHLPSDLAGLTWLSVSKRDDGNMSAAISRATLGIEQQIKKLSLRPRSQPGSSALAASPEKDLHRSLRLLRASAIAQGWRVRGNSETTFRLESRRGVRFSLPVWDELVALEQLDSYVRRLRANGLRVNQSVDSALSRRPLKV